MKSYKQSIQKGPENKKCSGCGIVLTSDITKSGYTPVIQKAKLCQRCFQLKHYGKSTIDENLVSDHVGNVINSFDFSKVAAFYVCSPCQLPFKANEINEIRSKAKTFYLVVSKIETLVNNLTNNNLVKQKIYDLVNKCGITLETNQIIPCSFFKRMNFSQLKQALDYVSSKKIKAAFCGVTNAGKSSLINWILQKEKVEKTNLLSTSYHKNTTQDIKQIKTRDFTILDLPGFIDTSGFQSVMSADQLRRFFTNFSSWKTKIFQLKNDRIFIGEDLFVAEVIIKKFDDKKASNLICYFNDSLKIKTGNLKNKSYLKLNDVFKNSNTKTTNIKLNSPYNLIILNSLGLIVAKNISEMSFVTNEAVSEPFVIENWKI